MDFVDKDYLKKYEVMKYMSIGQDKLESWIADGLPIYCVDARTIYISKADIAKYLEKFKMSTKN